MFAPSVRKELKRKLEQANNATQEAYKNYKAVRQLNEGAMSLYNQARQKYEEAIKAFPGGEARLGQVQEGRIPPGPGDQERIAQIGKLQSAVMAIADKFAVEIDHTQRLYNLFQGCVKKEKDAFNALTKYMEEKKTMKEDPEAYKKWKKELRSEMFK